MILLLGISEYVKKYIIEELDLNIEDDTILCPYSETHHTEYENELDRIKNEQPKIIRSQNIEFIMFLLKSDLPLDVWTVYDNGAVRKLTKEYAIEVYEEMGLDLR